MILDAKLRQALYYLERYNGIFRQLWELGNITFTDQIPTAAITFDKKTGYEMNFLFNPEFYDRLNVEQLAFVIGHECLHVMLYHGRRMITNQEMVLNPEYFNIAADISIHEIMFREFLFPRSLLQTMPIEPCTLESVFKDDSSIKQCMNMEYYFDKLKEKATNVKYVGIDEHMFNSDYAYGSEAALKKIFNRLSDVEKKELKNKLKDIQEYSKQDKTETVNNIYNSNFNTNPKNKWEMVIKEWAQAFLTSDRPDWTRKNRRFPAVQGKNMYLPSYLEPVIQKTELFVYLDTSGSCIDLAPRFMKAAASLPQKFFKPRVFCFDTEIYEVDLNNMEVQGGGGTSFSIIEDHMRKLKADPDFVFVTTDGMGDRVEPLYPHKWHIFLTVDYKDCFPKGCKFHEFSEFE